MKWIALTGGIATGKSTVARLIEGRGHPVIDADLLAREVVRAGQPGHAKLRHDFGPDIFLSSGELDRAKLAELVFSDEAKRLKVEQIIHPLIQLRVQELKAQALAQGHALCFYDVPLLFEKSLRNQFDYVVVVYTPEAQQILRIQARNPQWSADEIKKRLAAQVSIETKKQQADFVIDNEPQQARLEAQVELLLTTLLETL